MWLIINYLRFDFIIDNLTTQALNLSKKNLSLQIYTSKYQIGIMDITITRLRFYNLFQITFVVNVISLPL